MKPHHLFFSTLLALCLPASHAALDPEQALIAAPPLGLFQGWNAPIEPFEIYPQVYYVGTDNLSSILFDTGKGLVLIDSGIDASAPQIKANIEKLGFAISEVKYLLNSHARLDQAGGFAQLKAWSGAKLVASAANAEMLANGAAEDFALGDQLRFPPVQADIIVGDGDEIRLGKLRFTAHLTPGHLPGATSWSTEVGSFWHKQTVVYADSLFTGGYPLINNKNYPNIVSDMRHSFATLNGLQADIFLANKADRFQMKAKLAKLKAGDKLAFIDRNGLHHYVAAGQRDFEQQLSQQLSASLPQ